MICGFRQVTSVVQHANYLSFTIRFMCYMTKVGTKVEWRPLFWDKYLKRLSVDLCQKVGPEVVHIFHQMPIFVKLSPVLLLVVGNLWLYIYMHTYTYARHIYTFARRGARRRYMTSWHFIYNFICSFHTSLYVKCHILTRWWRHMTICGSGIWSVIWSVAHESKQGWEGGCDRAGEHEGSSFAATDREGL